MLLKFFLLLYQLFVALPIFLILTIITAIATLILYPLYANCRIPNKPAEWWSRLTCYLFFVQVQLTGSEKINPSQSYIFVSNHQSVFDIFALYGWMPNVFKWVMKIELKKIPLVGSACEIAGHVFIDRSNPLAAQESIKQAENKLVDGISLVVFPEGTRTHNGKISKFKKGAFRIAQDLQLPIVPITIKGSFERFPRGAFLVKPGKIELTIHNPIDVSNYSENINNFILRTHEIVEAGL